MKTGSGKFRGMSRLAATSGEDSVRRPAALPFLRSPPFPGISAARAAISEIADDADPRPPISDALIDPLADARVGGSFWGRAGETAPLVVRDGAKVPADLMARYAPGHVVHLPRAGQGRYHIDPWSFVTGAKAVCAPMDDELALVAGLSGVPVFDAAGVAIDSAKLRAVVAARIGAAHYRDPFSGDSIDVTDAITLLADWRRHIHGNRTIVAASGMAFWKREAITHFLWDGEKSPPFLSPALALHRAAHGKGAIAIWPSRVPPITLDEAAARAIPVARVEDGFLRSRGLGAGLHPPGSVVVDRTGIYYNARRPSDLETLLATHDFPPALVERARCLRVRVCATGVTKYGQDGGQMIELPAGRRTVLAIGQVDDDESVRLGGAGVDGNLDFLTRVRRAEPDAWIIYRPHPDVQAGHRKGHVSDAQVLAHADVIDRGGAPLMELVQAVDEVHVLSSLTGFEALMRGCSVTVHGMPFYAGWGLTRDLAKPVARRGRPLSLDQLVAAALILYPRYLDPVSRLPCGPEIMVERMAEGSAPKSNWLIRLRALQGKLRRFMTLSAEFLHG
jgi:capsular polysaccharide export protein